MWLQLWRHVVSSIGDAILDGFARNKGRCSAIGRNTMSADLQETVHALRSVVPPFPELLGVVDASLRHVDAYIKVLHPPGYACV